MSKLKSGNPDPAAPGPDPATAFDLSTPEGRLGAHVRGDELRAELNEWAEQFQLKNGRLASDAEMQHEMGATLTEMCDLGRRLFDADNAAARAARSANADPVSAATTATTVENTTSAE